MKTRWSLLFGVVIIVLFVAGCSFGGKAGQDQSNTLSGRQNQLSSTYFFPDTGSSYVFKTKGESEGTFSQTWEKLSDSSYESVSGAGAGEIYTDSYSVDSEGISMTETSSEAPQSEIFSDKVTQGKSIDMKFVEQGATWTSDYQTTGNGSVVENKDNYTYKGQEQITLMGKKMTAAKIVWEKSTKVLKQDENVELSGSSGSASGESWYVEGLGLVKSRIKWIGQDGSSFDDEIELISVNPK
jgi:hypothetical protein